MALARDANRYLDNQAPWHQVKNEIQDAARTLYISMTVIAGLKTILYPFLPFTSDRLHVLLGGTGDLRDGGWSLAFPVAGACLPEPSPLFTKLDESVIDEQIERLN
jgi:methionyl-tRNA synthetase